jgi:tRNA pseudouridine55 synthase
MSTTIKTSFDFTGGELLLINKPLTWTSFDAVNKIRYILDRQLGFRKIKVGHAGTLDPLATGLLIICTGKKTKQIDLYSAEEKEYTGTITLGSTTPSFDLETEPDAFFETGHITEESIREAAQKFIGINNQMPPIFSAKKVDGKRAYKKARKGEDVAVKPKEIEIKSFEITSVEMPLVKFKITCSKGTYIRSIAHDLGKALNSGAHLSELCRTRIGSFKIEDSLGIEQFIKMIDEAEIIQPNVSVHK